MNTTAKQKVGTTPAPVADFNQACTDALTLCANVDCELGAGHPGPHRWSRYVATTVEQREATVRESRVLAELALDLLEDEPAPRWHERGSFGDLFSSRRGAR